MTLPHMDTVALVMERLENKELEELQQYFVKSLIENKIFYKYKIFGNFYNVSIDATGVMNISNKNIKHFPNALFSVYNKGTEEEKTIYYLKVLEAKLVCANGFCISLCTQWIENPEEEYKKQDCELKAFLRLAAKLKSFFPRLPICIVGDGLYPCQSVFAICAKMSWEYIFTFKDGNIPSIWTEVEKEEENKGKKNIKGQRQGKMKEKLIQNKVYAEDESNKVIEKKSIKIYCWLNSITYKGFNLNWSRLIETIDGEIKHTFVYISSIKASKQNIETIILNGRLRAKIENEGFNSQKNLGYNLQHKFSETSEVATKNYYTCIQIGHLINQMFELSQHVKVFTKGRETIKSLWQFLIGTFTFEILDSDIINRYLKTKIQVRFG